MMNGKNITGRRVSFLEKLRMFLNRKKFHLMIAILSLWMALGALSGTFVMALDAWISLSAVLFFASIFYIAGYCLLYPLKYALGGTR